MEYTFSNKMAALKPSAIREIFKSLTDPTIISFAAGNPAPESFPVEALSAISADIFANSASFALQYGITDGYGPLREAVAARQKERFNIGREFDTTIITTGGQQGIELCCKVFCNEGDTVLCENPSFIGSLNAFPEGCQDEGAVWHGEGIVLHAVTVSVPACEAITGLSRRIRKGAGIHRPSLTEVTEIDIAITIA